MMDIIDFVIVASLMFVILICYHIIFYYSRKSVSISKEEYSLVKAILTEFKHRIDEQNKKISEIMIKVDLIENRIGGQAIKKEEVKSSTIQENIEVSTGKIERTDLNLSDIEISILKFISTGPRSSKEVQLSINKSREHTARLLKNLYSKNLLKRESQGKFFVYTLSEEGKKVIAGS